MKCFAYPLLALACAGAADAAVLIDDFESGHPHGWTFGVTHPDTILPDGGTPGRYLYNDYVASFAPRATAKPAVGTALYAALRSGAITRISIDAITYWTSVRRSGAFALVLRATRGTLQPDDDDFAFTLSSRPVPAVGEGWVNYSFAVPSTSGEATPAGWVGGHFADMGRWRRGMDWRQLMRSVDQIEFWWIDPRLYGLVHDSQIGIDSVRVELGGIRPMDAAEAEQN